jgi:hypothetical protein
MPKRGCQNINRTNKTSSYENREIITMISPHSSQRSSNQVALLRRFSESHSSLS